MSSVSMRSSTHCPVRATICRCMRVKDVLKQMLLGQAARVGAELSYSGIPRDYALEILVSAVSSIIWLWIRRGCKEAPEQICAIIEKNKTTAPVDIIR